jgi:hypothetical protein
MTITDSDLLGMLARAERDESVWAENTRQCGSAYNARRYGRASKMAELLRGEVSRRVIAAAEAMLEV